jgi:hypothetical protein
VHLVEVFLPIVGAEGAIPASEFTRVVDLLTSRFGGATIFSRSPGEGSWRSSGRTEHDTVVVVEAMVDELDFAWWASLRQDLEARFHQDVVLIRAHRTCVL